MGALRLAALSYLGDFTFGDCLSRAPRSLMAVQMLIVLNSELRDTVNIFGRLFPSSVSRPM
jgi:hypothetical protein